MKKHLLTLEQSSMFWWFPNLFLQLQFLVSLTDTWGPSGKFRFFDSLVSKTQWVKLNLQFCLSNHSCLFHPGFILEPPSRHFPQLESYLIASCSLPLSYHWFFLSEDFYLPLHLCFCCSPNTSSLEFDNWITVTYLASSLKSLSHLGHWIHGAKASRLLYHLAKKDHRDNQIPSWSCLTLLIQIGFLNFQTWALGK